MNVRKSVVAITVIIVLLGVIVAVGLRFQRTYSRSRERELAQTALETRQGALLVEQLLVQSPQDAGLWLLHARAQRMRNHIDRALQSLKRAEENGGPKAEINRERVLASARVDFAKTIPQLEALLNQNPHDQEVVHALALGWLQSKNFSKTESLVSALLEQYPDDGFALCLLGRSKLLQHNSFAARPMLEKAVGQGPEQYYYADARIMLAQCLLDTGDLFQAAKTYRECLADEPENTRAMLGLGRCNWHLGQWEDAKSNFEAILRLDPNHLDALSQLAYIHEERGEKVVALDLLEQAVKLDPTRQELHFRIAKLLVALGQNARAADALRRAEDMKKYWAKPRTGGYNSYTGEDPNRVDNRGDIFATSKQ